MLVSSRGRADARVDVLLHATETRAGTVQGPAWLRADRARVREYARNQQEALAARCFEDRRFVLTYNGAERALKPVSTGRENRMAVLRQR